MRFPPSLLDEIRARVPVSQVVSRKVALKRAGREFKGLSPFKQERTPSFTVNDQKGFYHCFATGEHGDIFTFLVKTEGLTFPEAVERLAQEAGVPLPKASPREQEVEDQRSRLYNLLAASAKFFEEALRGPLGREARRYLEGRALSREAIGRFRLGYAPGGRSALKEHLAQVGFSLADMVAAGMLIAGEDIPVPYDRFRNRIMFPITDLKGRVIAFGGRALDADAPAKYLNSPETPLFHKGAVLFNAANARGPAHDKSQVIVVEGYMDVIALSEAGFPQTVAPLGTALTADQVQLLWRLAPVPVLCFDGDAAGQRAAGRAVELVLPHLKPGYSVQFAFLPEGQDPDDLIRQQGAGAFEAVLRKTSPLFDELIRREEQRDSVATPEQRAALETRLRALVAGIADASVRGQYESELKEVLWARNRQRIRDNVGQGHGRGRAQGAGGAQRSGGHPGRAGPTGRVPESGYRRNNMQLDWRLAARATERSRLGGVVPRASAAAATQMRSNELAERSLPLPAREALIMGTLLNHPRLLEAQCERIASLTLTSPALDGLRQALLDQLAQNKPLERAEIRAKLQKSGLERVIAAIERALTHKSDKFVEPDAEDAQVEAGWEHAIGLHETQVGLRRELQSAERAYQADPTEDAFARIVELQQQLARGMGAELPDG